MLNMLFWIACVVVVLVYLLVMLTRDTGSVPKRPYTIDDCVYTHNEDGLDYPWLADIHGGLSHILWTEPPTAENWRPYNDVVWRNHCKMIDHTKNLVENHMRAFVYPDTRFARLMFVFRDGYRTEPTRDFYEREAKWFAQRYQPVDA